MVSSSSHVRTWHVGQLSITSRSGDLRGKADLVLLQVLNLAPRRLVGMFLVRATTVTSWSLDAAQQTRVDLPSLVTWARVGRAAEEPPVLEPRCVQTRLVFQDVLDDWKNIKDLPNKPAMRA